MKYISKPETVEAVVWTGSNFGEIKNFVDPEKKGFVEISQDCIDNLEIMQPNENSWLVVIPNQFVIKYNDGYISAQDPEDFKNRYQIAEV